MRHVGLAALTLLAALSGTARAQDLTEARRAFEQGVQLLEDARYAEAVAALERSRAIREASAVLYNLALAYRGTGQYIRAVATFERFIAVATPREARRADAEAIAAELRRAIARVQLRVVGGATEVRIDDRVIASEDIDRSVELDPGRHVIEARRRGHRPALRALTLSPGAREALRLDAGESPLPATLTIRASVSDATIVLDGRERGRGRFEGEVPPGVHSVEVSASGHLADRREIDVAPGANERVVVTLAQRPSVLTRWWFWTGAAVLVTGLVVGGVVLFSRSEDPVQGTWGTAYGAIVSW